MYNVLAYFYADYFDAGTVTDEMLGWAGESRNGFLCTCEGVEFLEYIRTSFFPFQLSSSFLHFECLQRNFCVKWLHYLGDNGNMATVPEKEAGLELDTTATHKVSKVKSTTLQELIGLGKDLGYSGKELQLFVAEQQDREREERKSEREARRAEAERETRKDEAEREARREEAERETRKDEAEREARREEAEREAKKEEAEREARREEAEREARREEAVREENERKWKAEMDAKQEEVRMRYHYGFHHYGFHLPNP